MRTFTTLALGICMTAAFVGTGFAASMSDMTSSEKATMTKCKGMSQSAMMADNNCAALMKKYPDIGTTGSSSSMSGGSGMNGTNGGMSGKSGGASGGGTSK